MKRRVIKHGPATYIVSLPSAWVKKQGITKGSEIDVIEHDNTLLIGNNLNSKTIEAKINVSGLCRTAVMLMIRGFYRLGYDTLNITFDKPTTVYQRTGEEVQILLTIHKEVNRLIGYEILEDGKNFCLIKDIQSTSTKDFYSALKRIFLLTHDMSTSFTEAVHNADKSEFNIIMNKHDTITRFISYCFRLLNKDNEQTHQLKFYHSMILSYLEEVVDILREASRDIRDHKRKLPKSVVEIIEDICKNLGIYYSTFYNFNKQKIVDINRHRHDVDKKIKDLPISLDSYSVYVVSSLSRILHNISHMSAQTSIHNLQHVTEKED